MMNNVVTRWLSDRDSSTWLDGQAGAKVILQRSVLYGVLVRLRAELLLEEIQGIQATLPMTLSRMVERTRISVSLRDAGRTSCLPEVPSIRSDATDVEPSPTFGDS
jgi:hypothetical protein